MVKEIHRNLNVSFFVWRDIFLRKPARKTDPKQNSHRVKVGDGGAREVTAPSGGSGQNKQKRGREPTKVRAPVYASREGVTPSCSRELDSTKRASL